MVGISVEVKEAILSYCKLLPLYFPGSAEEYNESL
jgi:hypothetical protein